ncbi:exonuclease SbcCD subunit D [Williamsia deligens]|uniref:Nuclease SbcCD subunit D n=1 Tax=Williamsia deligens TaxID=321325 RepID=A0ABW3G9M9_9NOCA|nr:exonuclease SbcCD subunit D [Williamsia deligens]MCP2196250.1 Exodeoxyribonuclease I subunit D [Williamsia deligens]
MRFLHTSDWHLGRTFHGVDLLDDQRRALRDVAAVVARESVDAVIVAGDVYDRSVPSADAVAVYDAALADIREAGAEIIVTSGNHDSPTRLGVGSSFAAAGGLHLRTSCAGIARPVVLSDRHGEIAVYGIPYLEPDAARVHLGVPDARGHVEVLGAAMDSVRAHLADHPRRSVVVAHAFVVGGESAGSERSISVGGVETVGTSTFSGVDYVALGHLHTPQEITASVRYSGSLLAYSFGERSHRKAVWIVDLDAHGLAEVRRHDLPVVRDLISLRGDLDDLLRDPALEGHENAYVRAELTDPIRPVDAMRRLRARFAHAVHVEWIRPTATDAGDYRSRVHGRSDSEIVRSFLGDVRSAPSVGEMALVAEALHAVVGEPEVAESETARPVVVDSTDAHDTADAADATGEIESAVDPVPEILEDDGSFALFALPAGGGPVTESDDEQVSA